MIGLVPSPLIVPSPAGGDVVRRAVLPFLPQVAPAYFVAATVFTSKRIGNTVFVSVNTLLPNLSTSPAVYYFWYLDGLYSGETATPANTFVLLPGQQAQVVCLESNDPGFDPIANAPAGYPSQRALAFVRSVDPTIAFYEIQQSENSGSWVTLGYIQDDPTRWEFNYITPVLDDLASYAWRVVPYNSAGNAGTAVTLGAELIVRTPDAPDWAFTWNAGTQKITFAAA